ncbi:hypothetical protein XELAEV_18015737mg, partial [Xenopus laevis]
SQVLTEGGDDDHNEEKSKKILSHASTPASPPKLPVDVSTFLSVPSPDKLVCMGPKCSTMIAQQVNVSDTEKIVQAFIQVSSVYRDEGVYWKHSEDKIKTIPHLNGPLLTLNHMVQQNYFPKSLVPILLENNASARHTLLHNLHNL